MSFLRTSISLSVTSATGNFLPTKYAIKCAKLRHLKTGSETAICFKFGVKFSQEPFNYHGTRNKIPKILTIKKSMYGEAP